MLAGRLFLSIETSCWTMRLSLTRSHVEGRDHVVTIRSCEGLLVVVNVHFEPDMRRFSLHWPRYPEALWGVSPRKGDSTSEGDTGKTALFRSFFPHALEIAQLKLTRKDTASDGTLRTLSRIDRAFTNVLMAEACVFHLPSCF